MIVHIATIIIIVITIIIIIIMNMMIIAPFETRPGKQRTSPGPSIMCYSKL